MIVQCGWCKELLGEKAPLNDTAVTHSICECCQKKLLAEYSLYKDRIKPEAA
jgi:hypothetical protein